MNIIEKRRIFLGISLVLVIVSVIAILVNGFKFAIDFTGGSRLELSNTSGNTIREDIVRVYDSHDININSIQEIEGGYRVSSATISEEEKNLIVEDLDAEELSFEILGPTIGKETRDKAIFAVFIAIIAITIYIAIAFWKSGGTISSWKFGAAAIITLFHDVIITLGAFSIFGVLFGVEVDSLFVTAILTIIGFSVHDTIVVFDRIREYSINNVKNISFEQVLNNSIVSTLQRSLNTSVTILFVLISMVIFGGDSIRWFMVAFIIGVVVGTYSSIFVAAPIILEWNTFDNKGGLANLRKRITSRK